MWKDLTDPKKQEELANEELVENMEEMVVYKSLSNNHVWIRPRKMWNEVVDDKGTLRFTLVE